MRPLPEDKIHNIEAMLSPQLGVRKIAAQTGISKTSVNKIRKTHRPDMPSSKGGRPKKLTAQDKRLCVRSITSGTAETATDVAKLLQNDLEIRVSRQTVSRALEEAGMSSAEKQKKPKLSPKNIKARLSFAKTHKDWTIDDWRRVVWSDETKINRFCSDGRSWYWKRDGESQQERHVSQTVKHGGGSIKIWGCMTVQGPGYMCKIDGNMDQHLYKGILEDELQKTLEWYRLKPDKVIFQQDNDSKHTAASVREWLNKRKFDTLEWPAQSPDLNPIEHLWAHIKKQLNKYDTAPKGILDLWERVQDQWNTIDASVCANLIDSMPRRVAAVIKAKGRWTKY